MDYILIGKIVNIHGIKGEVKVYPYTDDIHNLSKIKEFYLDNNGKEKYIVESARVHKNMLIVKIKDLSDPDEALRLKNKDIFIPKKNLEKLDEGTYYVFELIGLEVLDMDGNKIGTLNDVQNCSANDVYEIVTLDNKKIYLPAIKDVIKKVDIAGRKMYVEIMKGLI